MHLKNGHNYCCFFSILILNVFYFFSSMSVQAEIGLNVSIGESQESGETEYMNRYSVTSSFDHQWFKSNTGYLSGQWEISHLAWQQSIRDDIKGWAINPVFRYFIPRDNFSYFFSLGVGVSHVSDNMFNKRKLGSKWSFEDKLGAGIRFYQHHEVAIDLIHYSNASLKKHNQGTTMVGLTYAYKF